MSNKTEPVQHRPPHLTNINNSRPTAFTLSQDAHNTETTRPPFQRIKLRIRVIFVIQHADRGHKHDEVFLLETASGQPGSETST
jgi:hypothetical protein